MGVYSDDSAMDAAMFDTFTSDGGGESHSGGGGGNGNGIGCLCIILVLAIIVGFGKIYKSCSNTHDHADYNTERVNTYSDSERECLDFHK